MGSPKRGESIADLAVSDAVHLFVERAEAVGVALTLSHASVSVIEAICERVDGLPLAIELAAARTTHLTPDALLARLDHRLPLLTGGSRDAPERQRSLRETIAWSHDLLPASERALFRRCAVFAGGFSLDAAITVGAGTSEEEAGVLDGIGTLIERNLLQLETGPAGLARYRILETIREFGLEQLLASEEVADVRRRHAEHFFRLIGSEDVRDQRKMTTIRFLDEIDVDSANFRQALALFKTTGEVDRELELATNLGPYWISRGWISRGGIREGIAILEDAIQRGEDARLRVRINALDLLSYLYGESGDGERSLELSQRCMDLSKAADLDTQGRISILVGHGLALRFMHRDEEAIAVYEEAVRLGQAPEDQTRYWIVGLGNLGAALMDRGEPDRGGKLVEEAFERSLSSGFDDFAALTLARLGRLAQISGEPLLAVQRYAKSLRMSLEMRLTIHYDRVLVGLAGLAIDIGRAEAAARLLGAVETIQAHTGATSLMWPQERDRAITSARAVLGDEAFFRAIAEGRALPPSVATAEALELAESLTASFSSEELIPDATAHSPLSAREHEVLCHLAAGQSDREIGESLFISTRTVNAHVASIFNKLGVNSRAEAAVTALRLGVLSDPPNS